MSTFQKEKESLGNLPPKILAAPKQCNLMHINLIGPYDKSMRQHKTGISTINKYAIPNCMKKIDPATGCFKIVEVPCFNLEEVAKKNIEYMEKFSSGVIQMFNHTRFFR